MSLAEAAIPVYFRFSQQSRRKCQEQYTRVKRKLLDACSHPNCTYAERLIVKGFISSQFKHEHPPNGYVMLYDIEWPTISRALRDFPMSGDGAGMTIEYQIMNQARHRAAGGIG